MRVRVAIVLLVGALVVLGLLQWQGTRDSRARGGLAAAPDDAAVDPPTKSAVRASEPRPSAARGASAARAATTAGPAYVPGRPIHDSVAPAVPVDAAPRRPLATLADAPPATALLPRQTEALQAVPPQPLPPVSRVPLLPPTASSDADR